MRNTLYYISSLIIVSANDDDEEEDFLTIKRKNIELEDIDEELELNTSSKIKNKKAVTKAAIAKKILKKKIIPNKKTNFDDEGQVILTLIF